MLVNKNERFKSLHLLEKTMELKITEEKKAIMKDGKKIREEVVNRIIGHPDHKGKLRFHTEDELRAMCLNLNEVIEELDK